MISLYYKDKIFYSIENKISQSTKNYKTSCIRAHLLNSLSNCRATYTLLTVPMTVYTFSTRGMLNPRLFSVVRAAYNCFTILGNNDILNKTKKNNTRPFINEIVVMGLDHEKGILQQKTAFWKHLSTQKFPAEEFYESYIENQHEQSVVKWEPNISVDFRTLNEIGVLAEYEQTFGHDLAWILATLDARGSNFNGQKQSNLDFWVYIDQALGVKPKIIFQDEKSGGDIIRHTTRGSLGLLSYDQNGNNIQVTNKPITVKNLIVFNKGRINNIEQVLIREGFDAQFNETLLQARNITEQMNGKSFEKFSQLHNELQHLLWKDLQCNPLVTRSISFVFLKQIIEKPLTPREKAFSDVFNTNLKDRFYNIDQRQDFNDVFKAMLLAGKEIDPQFIQKLHYLNGNGITLTNNFLLIIADLVKHGIF